MNSVQEKFFNFIMNHVKEDKKEEAQQLLETSFQKQDNGTFDEAYMREVTPKILACIQEESIDLVSKLMKQHKI